jgi:hypothetical protein
MLRDFDNSPLRAAFSVEKTAEGWSIWLESGGGGRHAENARNPDHARALVVILERLKRAGAIVDDALVDSRNTRKAALSNVARRVLAPSLGRPIPLSGVHDIDSFALDLRTNGAAVQRVKASGGNPEKRLQLLVRMPTSYGQAELERLISSGLALASRSYTPANEDVSPRLPNDRSPLDAETVERGLRGHNRTQNALARFLFDQGIAPFSPKSGDPNFDLAWKVADTLWVAEIKSTTVLNEEKQLRLGVGQILRFAHQLGPGTRAVLVAEQQPSDQSWQDLCEAIGIVFCWPDCFGRVLV